jgi:hypothetical protein
VTVRVRDAEGSELRYPSLEAVRQALALGLVSPDDEVLAPGDASWTRAGGLGPAVAPARRSREPGTRLLALVGVVAAVASLALLRSGRQDLQLAGGALAFGLASAMFAFTTRAFRRRGR